MTFRAHRRAEHGFTLVELMVVIAIIGVLMVLGMPNFISYWRNSTLKAGAQEVIAILNSGRQLAIKENLPICIRTEAAVAAYGTRVRYILRDTATNSCTATATCVSNGSTTPCIWTGAGTDGSGYMTLANQAQLSQLTPSAGNDVTFSYLGAAQTPGTYSVRIINASGTATVTVQTSGRVQYAFP